MESQETFVQHEAGVSGGNIVGMRAISTAAGSREGGERALLGALRWYWKTARMSQNWSVRGWQEHDDREWLTVFATPDFLTITYRRVERR